MTPTISKDVQLRRRSEAVILAGMYGHQSVDALPDDYRSSSPRGAGAYMWGHQRVSLSRLMCAYGRVLRVRT